jgi:hypothetical protein
MVGLAGTYERLAQQIERRLCDTATITGGTGLKAKE